MIRVTLDEKNAKLAETLMRSMPDLVQRAAANAINRTITATRKEISKAVRERYLIRAGDVKRALSLEKAKKQSPRGVITARGTPLSLAKFRLRKSFPPLIQMTHRHDFSAEQHFVHGFRNPVGKAAKLRYDAQRRNGPYQRRHAVLTQTV